jgi:hypothetical protein
MDQLTRKIVGMYLWDTCSMTNIKLQRQVRDLLWFTCRQREKTPLVLRSILLDLYPGEELREQRDTIEKEYLDRIGYD